MMNFWKVGATYGAGPDNREDAMAESSTDPAESEQTPADHKDAKQVLAEALERKRAAGQARAAHLDGHGGVGGNTANHKATRTFRRKSG